MANDCDAASHCKVHPDAAGAEEGNQHMNRTKGGARHAAHSCYYRRYKRRQTDS